MRYDTTGKITIDTSLYQAYIFDMDGLLLDTERICWECFKEVCIIYGHHPDFNIYKNCIGRSVQEGDIILEEGFRGLVPYKEVKIEWNNRYYRRIENGDIPLKNGVADLLRSLRSVKARMAVATSTGPELANRKLSGSDIIDYFEFVLSGETLERSKPHPEIYLRSAAMLGVLPEKCLAFEDSDNGVRSAHAAGIDVIQVADMFEPSTEVVRFGHIITDSLSNIVIK